MQNNNKLSEQEMQRKGRMMFMAMLIFFIVPIIVVMSMYQFNWKPTGVSLGEMVTPPRLINSPAEIQSNNAIAPVLLWKERWSMVYVADDCQRTCMDKLHDMRQLHASFYKDIERTQRVLITTSQDVDEIKHNYPDLIIINQPVDGVLKLSEQFQIDDENVAMSNRLYLVDPLGHLMMSYKTSVPLAAVRKDIARLLRYSWAG